MRVSAVAFPASHRIASLELCYFKSASSLIRLEIAIGPRYVEFFPSGKSESAGVFIWWIPGLFALISRLQ